MAQTTPMEVRVSFALASADALRAEDLYRHLGWSISTFGPGPRLEGCINHLRKELDEILASPDDLSEWADALHLLFDGALRRGFTPAQIFDAFRAKQVTNESRTWPDWRTVPADSAIEHDRQPHPLARLLTQDPPDLKPTDGVEHDIDDPTPHPLEVAP